MKRRAMLKSLFLSLLGFFFPGLAIGKEKESLLIGQDQIPCKITKLRYQGNPFKWIKEQYSDSPIYQIHYFPQSIKSLQIKGKLAVAFKTWEFEGFVQNLLLKINDSGRYLHYSTPHLERNRNGNQVFSELLGFEVPDDPLSGNFQRELQETINHDHEFSIIPLTAFGSLVGYHSNLSIYSNGSTGYFSGKLSYYGSYCTGYKWQCVEWIVRYFKAIYGLAIRGGNANTFYSNAASKGLLRFTNGGTTPPKPGDILCSAGGSYGHVGIVREVDLVGRKLTYSQQNWFQDSQDVQARMSLSVTSGRYTLAGFSYSYKVQGWLRAPEAMVLPETVNVSPTTGSWNATPQNVTVFSLNAEQIFYSLSYTLDGSEPAEPAEPSTNSNVLPSGSGALQLYAPASQIKRIKVKLRGHNKNGFGPTSPTYSYTLDLRAPQPNQSLKVTNPTPGEKWETSKTHTIRWIDENISSSARLSIYYSLDNGTTWYAVDEDTGNDGEKSWSMSNDSRIVSTKIARLKVILNSNPNVFVISEPFEIYKN